MNVRQWARDKRQPLTMLCVAALAIGAFVAYDAATGEEAQEPTVNMEAKAIDACQDLAREDLPADATFVSATAKEGTTGKWAVRTTSNFQVGGKPHATDVVCDLSWDGTSMTGKKTVVAFR